MNQDFHVIPREVVSIIDPKKIDRRRPLKQRRCAFSGLVLKYRNRLENSIPSTHSASTFQWPLDHQWTNFVQSEGKRMKKYEQVNDLGITVKSAFTPSANALRDLNYAERLKALEAIQLFKLSRRPGLRRSSPRLLQLTGRTRRRRNSFAC